MDLTIAASGRLILMPASEMRVKALWDVQGTPLRAALSTAGVQDISSHDGTWQESGVMVVGFRHREHGIVLRTSLLLLSHPAEITKARPNPCTDHRTIRD